MTIFYKGGDGVDHQIFPILSRNFLTTRRKIKKKIKGHVDYNGVTKEVADERVRRITPSRPIHLTGTFTVCANLRQFVVCSSDAESTARSAALWAVR